MTFHTKLTFHIHDLYMYTTLHFLYIEIIMFHNNLSLLNSEHGIRARCVFL